MTEKRPKKKPVLSIVFLLDCTWNYEMNEIECLVFSSFPHTGSGAGSGTAGSGTASGGGSSSNRASGTGNESSSHKDSESSIAGGVGESVVTGLSTNSNFILLAGFFTIKDSPPPSTFWNKEN